jgi:hypothetical protein
MRDVKEIIEMLMSVVAGGEATRAEVEELDFEADEALQPILDETFIKLLEFAFDHDERIRDPVRDEAMRRELDRLLNEIARLAANGDAT